jgi:hypothetical protein
MYRLTVRLQLTVTAQSLSKLLRLKLLIKGRVTFNLTKRKAQSQDNRTRPTSASLPEVAIASDAREGGMVVRTFCCSVQNGCVGGSMPSANDGII